MGRDLTRVLPVDQAQVAETVARSWYSYAGGDGALLQPYRGRRRRTTPAQKKPPYAMINPGAGKYSWLKAPRYEGRAYEGGSAGPGDGGIRQGYRPSPPALTPSWAKLGG